MELPNYVFIAPQPGLEGAGLVLMTKAPYCLGKVVKFDKEDEYENYLSHIDYPAGKVTGYRVCILYAGTLNDMTEGIGNLKIMQTMLDEMARWYFENKIKDNQGGFRRFISRVVNFLL